MQPSNSARGRDWIPGGATSRVTAVESEASWVKKKKKKCASDRNHFNCLYSKTLFKDCAPQHARSKYLLLSVQHHYFPTHLHVFFVLFVWLLQSSPLAQAWPVL